MLALRPPSTAEGAGLSTLDRLGEDAKVLAGGQSLIPLMKLRFAAPNALVDINGSRASAACARSAASSRSAPWSATGTASDPST
jgi:CO/xanthine dehydrogenase FAD-binding subunit